MTTTQDRSPISIADQFFTAFDRGQIDSAFALVSTKATWWVPGTLPFSGTKSKAEYLQVVGAIQAGFPAGLSMKVTGMIADGDRVAVEAVSEGDHVNGRRYNNRYHFLLVVRDGLIVEVKEYMDTLHLYHLIAS